MAKRADPLDLGTVAARVGERVRDWRNLRGMTQRDLARRIGTSQAMLCCLEGGTREGRPFNVRLDTLLRLARALDTDPKNFL